MSAILRLPIQEMILQVGIDKRSFMRKPQFVDGRQTLPWDYFLLARHPITERLFVSNGAAAVGFIFA
jgi:hypothetical protein